MLEGDRVASGPLALRSKAVQSVLAPGPRLGDEDDSPPLRLPFSRKGCQQHSKGISATANSNAARGRAFFAQKRLTPTTGPGPRRSPQAAASQHRRETPGALNKGLLEPTVRVQTGFNTQGFNRHRGAQPGTEALAPAKTVVDDEDQAKDVETWAHRN